MTSQNEQQQKTFRGKKGRFTINPDPFRGRDQRGHLCMDPS